MTTHPTIRFVGDHVHKRYAKDVGVEFAQAQALWAVSQSCGFLCPEPVELREAESVIVYRNLRGFWCLGVCPQLLPRIHDGGDS